MSEPGRGKSVRNGPGAGEHRAVLFGKPEKVNWTETEFWGQQMSKGRQEPDLEGPWARGEHSRRPLERFQVGEDVTTDAIN